MRPLAVSSPPVDTSTLVPASLVDAKGDLLVGTADNTVARKAVSATNGRALVSASGQSDGLDWIGLGVSIYGDGSDGNVTISGTTTLTKDMFYDALTVQNGGVLNANGYRVHCKTSCTVDSGGVIHNDGSNAAENVGGAQTSSSSTIGNGAAGVNGVSGAGSAGNAIGQSMGGNGGAGGAGTGGAGGAAGTVTALTKSFPRAAPLALFALAYDRSLGLALAQGGASGGSGGGGTVNSGGSGAGGGSLMLAARTLTNNGRISANGGNGGGRSTGTNYGGGGGGGGGLAICLCDTFSGTNPTANGGSGGAGAGSGVNGSSGSAGTVVLLKGS